MTRFKSTSLVHYRYNWSLSDPTIAYCT